MQLSAAKVQFFSDMCKKNRPFERFFFVGIQLSAVSIQPFLAAEFVVLQVEDVLVEGLLAARLILMCAPCSLVSLDGAQVRDTGLRSSRSGCQTSPVLLGGYIPQNRVYMSVSLS